jgi:hypothetical protein
MERMRSAVRNNLVHSEESQVYKRVYLRSTPEFPLVPNCSCVVEQVEFLKAPITPLARKGLASKALLPHSHDSQRKSTGLLSHRDSHHQRGNLLYGHSADRGGSFTNGLVLKAN